MVVVVVHGCGSVYLRGCGHRLLVAVHYHHDRIVISWPFQVSLSLSLPLVSLPKHGTTSNHIPFVSGLLPKALVVNRYHELCIIIMTLKICMYHFVPSLFSILSAMQQQQLFCIFCEFWTMLMCRNCDSPRSWTSSYQIYSSDVGTFKAVIAKIRPLVLLHDPYAAPSPSTLGLSHWPSSWLKMPAPQFPLLPVSLSLYLPNPLVTFLRSFSWSPNPDSLSDPLPPRPLMRLSVLTPFSVIP